MEREKLMRRFLNRRRVDAPQRDDVIRRQVITAIEPSEPLLVEDERLQSEIRDLMKDQAPGRYRVKVRRKLVHL
jgi:hypothetical protein